MESKKSFVFLTILVIAALYFSLNFIYSNSESENFVLRNIFPDFGEKKKELANISDFYVSFGEFNNFIKIFSGEKTEIFSVFGSGNLKDPVYVLTSRGIFITNDSGLTWNNIKTLDVIPDDAIYSKKDKYAIKNGELFLASDFSDKTASVLRTDEKIKDFCVDRNRVFALSDNYIFSNYDGETDWLSHKLPDNFSKIYCYGGLVFLGKR